MTSPTMNWLIEFNVISVILCTKLSSALKYKVKFYVNVLVHLLSNNYVNAFDSIVTDAMHCTSKLMQLGTNISQKFRGGVTPL